MASGPLTYRTGALCVGDRPPRGRPVTVKSERADFDQGALTLIFSGGATAEQDKELMSGETLTGRLNEQKQLQKVEARGNRFRVFVDGEQFFDFTDPANPRGGIGLTSFDTANRFRNIKVTDPKGAVLFEGLPHALMAKPAGPAGGSKSPKPVLPVAPPPRPKP